MLTMLRAHGLDPGPTQRPLTAGTLAGLAAALPGLAVLDGFGWFDTLGPLLDATPSVAVLVCAVGFTLAGTAYGLLFGRGANDPVGGWLFGLGFGFLLWMLVPLPLLQWLPGWFGSDRPLLIGLPALGLLLGALVWGSALGTLFPLVHRQLRAGIESEPPEHARLGPEAAAVPEIGNPPPDATRQPPPTKGGGTAPAPAG